MDALILIGCIVGAIAVFYLVSTVLQALVFWLAMKDTQRQNKKVNRNLVAIIFLVLMLGTATAIVFAQRQGLVNFSELFTPQK